jgi:hypothetical protein
MPQSSEWLYSPSRNRVFAVCSYFTVAMLALFVCEATFSLFFSIQPFSIENPAWPIRVAFWILFLILAACVLSQLYLWVGMIVWTAFWCGEWIVLRVLLLLAQLLTLSFGSAIVYVFLYRRQHISVQRRVAQGAGVSA